MSEEKTHYRKVFKSDHLGVADLEDLTEAGTALVFRIKQVRQEIGVRVAGAKGNHNIAYFHENIKPWVINATNSRMLRNMTGSPFVEDWRDLTIQLYVDPSVKMKGEVVGGIKINPNYQPGRRQVTPENETLWENAKKAFKRDGNFTKVLERADISEDHQKLIMEQVANG